MEEHKRNIGFCIKFANRLTFLYSMSDEELRIYNSNERKGIYNIWGKNIDSVWDKLREMQ